MAPYHTKSILLLSFYFIFVGLLWTSCTKSENSEKLQTKSIILNQSIKLHKFSDPIKPDTFKLTVTGSSLMQSKTTFEIISSTGKSIYNDTFDTKFLVNYDIKQNSNKSTPPTEDEEIEFIKNRLKTFFDSENFAQPAIDSEESLDEDYNSEYWDEIKADRKAVSFTYLVGEENNKSIAYSKKLKKTIVFWNCC